MTRAIDRRAMTIATLLIGAAIIAVIASERAAPGSLLPHGYCFTWNATLLWTHVISDSLIGAAYVSIPLTLVHLLRKRRDIPFNGIFLLFALFILSCSATHWIEVWTVWNPDYWLSGNVKVLTAVASILTAVALVRLVPLIVAIPTVAELTAAKEALEAEVVTRREAEQALLRERADLERRVLERTEQLMRATAAAERAHAGAEEANKLKDRFLAKVSHELRTPLQSTLGWAHVLQLSLADAAQVKHAADRIMHNVKSQARLIDDLLDISRILSGKLSLQATSVDAFQVIHKAVEVVRSASAARGIDIEVVTQGASTIVHSDPVRLEQVVWNLVNNAVQASPEAGKVRLEAGIVGTELRIEVRDWGRGIDPLELPHLFEPFRQVTGSGSSHRGLGLGLAIARSIVDLFGGDLQAHSEGPGRGATFTLRLPASGGAPGPAESSDSQLTAEERKRLAGSRILYVEDDADIAEAGRLALEALGAEVVLCLDVHQASDRLRSTAFDVILSDLNLGDGHSALELLPILRSTLRGRETPAIVLSAYGSTEDRQASLKAGFAAHLVKPVGAADLARALLDALAGRNATAA